MYIAINPASTKIITNIKITRGVAEISEQQEIVNTHHWNWINIKGNDVMSVLENIKKISAETINESIVLTDVEYLRFDLQYADESTKTFWFLYDYYSNKEYLMYERQLYLLTDYSSLWNNHLQEKLFLSGDARIYRNSNINNLSFRYKQHWTDGLDYYEFLFQAHDFANIQQYETNIDNREKAVEYLYFLLNLPDCKSLCFYDKTMDYYFIELYNPNGFSTLNGNDLYDVRYGRGPKDIYVIVDSKGAIIELYSIWTVLYEDHFKP